MRLTNCLGFLLASILYLSSCKTERKEQKNDLFNVEEIKSLSETVGQILFATLESYAPYYDFDVVMSTLQEIEKGERPALSRNTCQLAMLEFRERIADRKALINLAAADQFLVSLSQKEGIHEVQKGKVYYEILHQGTGSALSEDAFPTLHFTETDLSNKKRRDSREKNKPVKIKLDETLPGFRKGVVGMRQGERRKIYVHPDLADGKFGENQLVIFDVEILDKN